MAPGRPHSPTLPTQTHPKLQQRGENQGHSPSPLGHPLSPRVQLVLEVLEGPGREKRKEKNQTLKPRKCVIICSRFLRVAGKGSELSVYFLHQKIHPKAPCVHVRGRWEQQSPGTASPTRARGKCHLLLGLRDQGGLPPACPGQEERKKKWLDTSSKSF